MPVRAVNPNSEASDTETKQVLEPVLQRVRRRLLDLSGNNALLNYKHPKASSLRVVDEVPAQVFQRLLDGGRLSFASLPEPLRGRTASPDLWTQATVPAIPATADPRERARLERKASQARRDARRFRCAEDLGIRTDYDLPKVSESGQSNHRDGKLQTLLFPEELEDQLRKIHRTATTALEETGANRLHLLFGFVEWSEAGYGAEERVTRLAPLVLVPVALHRRDVDRETNTYRYTLERTGEDWSANVTLQEKCRVDFGFVLPDPEDDDESLEHYFDRVERVLRGAQPEWRLRRYLTLGLVSFGKVLMWRDLDPDNWPSQRPIFASTPLRKLLGAKEAVDADGAAGRAGGTEYPLDQLDEGPGAVPPVVIEADSSQHSALVDVERGLDLVLQGPPGTGKSQTITNLIAAAIKHGRRVLFVAEKKAALDVVFTRLRAAGLGEFCLALHSHSTAKREFIAELGHRLAMRDDPPARPRELPGLTERLLKAREALARPLDALHSAFGAVEMTPYEIFWRARRLAATIPPEVLAAVQELRLPQVTQASRQTVAARRDMVDDFAGAFGNVRAEGPRVDHHPWAGITHDDIAHAAVEDLLDAARAWRGTLAQLAAEAAAAEEATGVSIPRATAGLRALTDAVARLEPLPASVDAELPHRLLSLTSVSEVQAAVEAVAEARRSWMEVEGPWGTPGALVRSDAVRVESSLRGVAARFAPTDYVGTVRETAGRLRAILERLAAVERLTSRIVDALGGEERLRAVAANGQSSALSAAAAAALGVIAGRTMALDPVGLSLLRQPDDGAATRQRIEELAARASSLRTARAEQDERFQPSFRPAIDVLRSTAEALATAPRFLPTVFSGAYRRAVRTYRAMSGGVKSDREVMTQQVRGLVAHLDAATAFAADTALLDALGPHAAGMDSPFEAASAAARWHEELREVTLPLGDPGRELATFARAASMEQWREALERIRSMPAEWEVLKELGAMLGDVTAVAGRNGSTLPGKPLAEVRGELADLLARCESLLATAESAGLKSTGTLMALAERFARVQEAWRAEDRVAARAEVLGRLGVVTAGAETNVEPLAATLQYVGRVQGAALPAAVERWLLEGDARARLESLKGIGVRVAAALERAGNAALPLLRDGRLDARDWMWAIEGGNGAGGASASSVDEVPVDALIRRLDHALGREAALYPWAVYRRSRAIALANGLDEIVALVEDERLGRDHAGDAYEAAFYRNLAKAALRQLDVLDAFDSGVHSQVRDRFARLDAEREELMRREIAAQLSRAPSVWGCAGPRVGDMTEEALIRHQAGLQRRHLAIRELFRRAGRAIQSLKPCFLMGPQAVAQYLPPGEFEFDLVVMDEASQMRPEDALGAIARGKQVLVVGDPMQLGPSRFFDRMDAGEDDELPEDADEPEAASDGLGHDSTAAEASQPTAQSGGATVLERSESILLAAASCLPVRMLRWHYRSRHPRLIAFSNREFYHERLVVFPTPGMESDGDGVFLHRVEGLYAGRRNEREAQAVVEEARRHARERPDQSLLIATLNAEQADLIDGLIEEAEKDDPVFGDYRARHEDTQEPFAIKNLENVQGDERDRILVTVTFGPREDGKLRQNFGPINQAGGERRLNVLFTRAKHRLDVFCSFDPNALRVSETTSPRGLRVLRDYLRYANGELWWAQGVETGREPDSDFEIAVATALRARGYEVRAQVGVAGYFIDLAVRDPDMPGRFLLGVECDGATYHSAKSARDRDRLRQRQLESLGWTLHRIWSTDWFKDPDGQTTRLVQRIEELRRERAAAEGAA